MTRGRGSVRPTCSVAAAGGLRQPTFAAGSLGRTTATRLGRSLYLLLGVSATWAVLLAVGVAVAHSEPPLIDSELATNVTATAADLRTGIDPEGLETHYRFEYGTTPSYGADAPVPDGEIGAAESEQVAAVHVGDLEPSTTYYFRVVATNDLGTVTGSAQTLTTFPLSGELFALPDNRVYELVSPPDKNGGDVGGESFGGSLASGLGESSVSGSAITYASFTSFGGALGAAFSTQYLSSRGPTGWTTQAISPPTSPTAQSTLTLAPFHFFTPELTAGVLDWTHPALTAQAPQEFDNLYVHETNAASYELVTTVVPPNRAPEHYEVKFAGASTDLTHVVFDANDALTAGAPANAQSVYEWTGGSLQLVSVLPGPGHVAAASAGAGDGIAEHISPNDVSVDGSRIFWTDNNGQLYVREDGATTVQLNASQRAPSLGDGSAVFRAATPDGSKVFFTDETPLTSSPEDNGGLYEYDFDSGRLTDLSPDGSGAPGVEGVVGAGEDGASVYFLASASLAAGATGGAENLYLSHDGATTFIAALSSKDGSDWTQDFEERTARVTPDGGYLVFMSKASLTGYDNTDANTDEPDTEVFIYDAGANRLICASCNPSGERPIGPSEVPTTEHTGYLPRYISEDGQRVFFDSKDSLLPLDTNDQQNVYEYENGAVYPISPGTSEGSSTFADASPDGDDVFFTTRARLVAEDQDENSDMYDARVGGGFPAGVSPAPCSGEGCRGPLNAPPVPVGVATETDSVASEDSVAAALPKASSKSKTRPRKSKTGRRHRKAKAGRPARKSKAGRSKSKAGRSARKGAGRSARRLLGRGGRAT